MSGYDDFDMQEASCSGELDNVDWGQLQEEVLNEPWLKFDDFNWAGWDHEGAEASSGDR